MSTTQPRTVFAKPPGTNFWPRRCGEKVSGSGRGGELAEACDGKRKVGRAEVSSARVVDRVMEEEAGVRGGRKRCEGNIGVAGGREVELRESSAWTDGGGGGERRRRLWCEGAKRISA